MQIADRVAQIKAQIEETTSDFDRGKNFRKDLQNWQAA